MPRCPLCQNYANYLVPIANPGPQYSECCSSCEQVAALITRDYPYKESWYNDFIRYFPVLLLEPFFNTVSESDTVRFGADAREPLKLIRRSLTEELKEKLENQPTIDVIVSLARLFDDLTYTLTNPEALTKITANAQATTEKQLDPARFAIALYDLRTDVVLLQNLAVKFGSNEARPAPSMHALAQMLWTARAISYVSGIEDALFYGLNSASGIAIISGRIIPINAQGTPVGSDMPHLYDETLKELRDPSSFNAINIREEFYRVAHLLDEPCRDALGFKIGDLFKAYIALAQFAERRKRLIVLTPFELHQFLSRGLQFEERCVDALAAYLKCNRLTATINPHEVQTFYSPLFVAPVGKYELIVLSAAIIDFSRSSFFHDFTYGTHSLFSKNEKLRHAYARMKQEEITGPFERKVAETLVRLGWRIETNAEGGLPLENKTIAVIPKTVGEIDFIGLSPDKKVLIVGDCKYLADYGATAKELRTVRQRFSGDKSYFNQLAKKHKWVAEHALEVSKALGNTTNDAPLAVKGVIVTRNRVPLQNVSDIPLVALYDLPNWIEKIGAI